MTITRRPLSIVHGIANHRLVDLASGAAEAADIEAPYVNGLRDGWDAALSDSRVPAVFPASTDLGIEAFDAGLRARSLAEGRPIPRLCSVPYRFDLFVDSAQVAFLSRRRDGNFVVTYIKADGERVRASGNAEAIVRALMQNFSDGFTEHNAMRCVVPHAQHLVTLWEIAKISFDMAPEERRAYGPALAQIHMWRNVAMQPARRIVLDLAAVLNTMFITADGDRFDDLAVWLDRLDIRARGLGDITAAISDVIEQHCETPKDRRLNRVESQLVERLAWRISSEEELAIMYDSTTDSAADLIAGENFTDAWASTLLGDARWSRRAHWSGDRASGIVTRTKDSMFVATLHGTLPPRLKIGRKCDVEFAGMGQYGRTKVESVNVEEITLSGGALQIAFSVPDAELASVIDGALRMGSRSVPVGFRPRRLSASEATSFSRNAAIRLRKGRTWMSNRRTAVPDAAVRTAVPAWLRAAAGGSPEPVPATNIGHARR